MPALGRYPRALARCWIAAIDVELEYRVNFAIAALTGIGTMAGALFSLSLFYQHDFSLGGWSWSEVLIVVGLYTTLGGIQESFLAPNYRRLTTHVREGTLDFVLLKPLDSQFLVSAGYVSPWGLPDVALGLAIVGYGAATHVPALPPTALLAGVLPLVTAVVVLYSLGFALATLTIWFTKLWNLTHALTSLLQAGRVPISAYPVGYRVFFTFVVPVAFMTTVPAQAIVGKADATPWVAGAAALALALAIASRLFWRYALRYYTSASS